MSRAGAAVQRARARAADLRRAARERMDGAALTGAPWLYRQADRLAAAPFRDERGLRPAGTILDDLTAYTHLPADVVERLVSERRPVDFRGEWHATPPELRDDHWFYLSSKTYLFANAEHFSDEAEVDAVSALLPAGATVLEFGAGVGNLSIALAGRGYTVIADELSALQRDFVRFRAQRHGLGALVSVVDPWEAIPGAAVDAVTAFDVLEHLPDGRAVLDTRVLPALRLGGALIENSPFVVNAANPMHHEDWGLDEHLRSRGLTLERTDGAGTRVWRWAG